MTHRILISDNLSPKAADLLRDRGFEVVVEPGMSPEALLAAIPEFDGLLVRSASKVTAEVLAASPRLKVVGRAGTGVDNIDLAAATANDVLVMNTPGGNAVAVAEFVLGLMLAIGRHIAVADRSMAEGRWDKKKLKGTEINGKTLAIFGLGHIGRALAPRAAAMGMTVLGYDPFVTAEQAASFGIEKVDLDDAFARADVLTFHLPLTPDTRHMVDADTLAKTKPGVWVINAARGGIVDEAALHAAVESGHVGGAALDVFEKEPMAADHPLRDHAKVIVTPHLGGSTNEAQVNVAVMVAEQVGEFLGGGEARNVVNK